MERALIMYNPDDSHTDDKTKRLERLLRRREARIDSLKHNHVASASRTTAMICRNTNVLMHKNDHMIDDDVDSHMSKNLKSPNTNNKRKRLERLLRRQDARSDSLKQNRVASASRTTAMICGNTNVIIDKNHHTIDDDVDEDWATFLEAGGGDDDDDEDYGSFLFTYNPDIKNGSDEVDRDFRTFLATYDPDFESDSASNRSGGSNIGVDVGNCNNSDAVDSDYQSFLPTYDPGYSSDGVGVDEDDHRLVNLGSELLGQSSSVKRNSLVSDPAFEKNNELFLNPVTIIVDDDDDKEYMHDKNTPNTSKVEDGVNSSDPDLIILESYQICEDTPFVPSKRYDSSCFEEEMNPKDNMQIAVYDDSQFRRRLLEHLARPYDKEEYKSLLLELCDKKQQERHFETRRGVVKSYQTEGVMTPYHKMYPDLSKAIAKESKNKRRVLFLARGFFFYMKNLCHVGSFPPWLDKPCLELMRKL